jgi:CheY-like chemotaxis protein
MRIRILVVEDYKPLRQFVCSALEERAEFQVVGQASDGLEAIQKAAELQPDLILLDIGLPKLNGITAATRIGQLAKKSKILFWSQDNDAEIVKVALRTGGSGYVIKSDPVDELFEAIKTVVQGGQFVSRELKQWTTGNTAMPWKLVGKVLSACSCDSGCPCNFGGLPTMGKCEGGWTWHVEDGTYGDVRLSGLNFSVYASWPGPVHQGNGEAVIFIDEHADNSQRSAIGTLVEGTAGGPWGLLAWTWPKVHGPYPVPYEIELDGVKTNIKCEGSLEIEGRPIPDPVTGAESRPGVVLPEGIIFKAADLGMSVCFRLTRDVQYDHSGKHLSISQFDYSGPTE